MPRRNDAREHDWHLTSWPLCLKWSSPFAESMVSNIGPLSPCSSPAMGTVIPPRGAWAQGASCFLAGVGTTVARRQGGNRHMPHGGSWRDLRARGRRSLVGGSLGSAAPLDRPHRATRCRGSGEHDAGSGARQGWLSFAPHRSPRSMDHDGIQSLAVCLLGRLDGVG